MARCSFDYCNVNLFNVDGSENLILYIRNIYLIYTESKTIIIIMQDLFHTNLKFEIHKIDVT